MGIEELRGLAVALRRLVGEQGAPAGGETQRDRCTLAIDRGIVREVFVFAEVDDPQLRATMGARGRTRATHLFDARRMADDVEAVYRLVCGFESEPASA